MMAGAAEEARARLRAVEPEGFLFEDDGAIPNNPELPLLLYAGVVDLDGAADPAAVCEALFAANGWAGSWRDGVFPYPHYHSTAHEVLGVCRGRAELRLGGAKGVVRDVAAGDVVVIPAGVGHQNLGATGDFLVVGAYPRGHDWDLCRGRPEERPRVLDNIANVPRPAADPVHGAPGPLLTHWRA